MISSREERNPLYKKVRDHLRAEYVTGTRQTLPSLRYLSQKLEINHATITRALRELEKEGVVEIVPRKGIYLTGRLGSPSREDGFSQTAPATTDPDSAVAPGAVAPPKPARGLNVEMVVLYDNAHEQLDVARPIYEGVAAACRTATAALAAGHEGLPMRIRRSEISMAALPDVCDFVDRARQEGTEGVIFLGYGYLRFPESLAESRFIFEVSRHLPVVLAGAPHAQLHLDTAYCDPRPQMREFLEECHALGLRRYEFLGSGTGQPHQLERHEEFCHFIMSKGLTWKREYLGEESVERLAERIRELPELPEVVIATNVSRALVVALEAQRRGLELPKALRLLTFASFEQHAQPLLPYASVLLMDEPGVGAEAWHLLRDRLSSARASNSADGLPPAPIVQRIGARFISRHLRN